MNIIIDGQRYGMLRKSLSRFAQQFTLIRGIDPQIDSIVQHISDMLDLFKDQLDYGIPRVRPRRFRLRKFSMNPLKIVDVQRGIKRLIDRVENLDILAEQKNQLKNVIDMLKSDIEKCLEFTEIRRIGESSEEIIQKMRQNKPSLRYMEDTTRKDIVDEP